MTRVDELVRIPNPYPPQRKLPVNPDAVRALRVRASQLVRVCLQNGVLNWDEARDFVKKANEVFWTVDDLQSRLLMRESFDAGDIYDLRGRWKDEYRKFIRFRDTVRDTLNTLVQNGRVSVVVSDAVKSAVDRFYEQMMEIDRTVQTCLRGR